MRTLPILLLLAAACTRPCTPPLVDAARNGDAATIRTLCARGANPDEARGEHGWTPLLHAVHGNQLASAAALLDVGAAIDRPAPNGTTPLMMAAGYGHRDMVELLLDRGASPARRDAGGAAAIDYALTGVVDVDTFTFFRCQSDTVALLREGSPGPQRSSARWAGIKCGAGLQAFVRVMLSA